MSVSLASRPGKSPVMEERRLQWRELLMGEVIEALAQSLEDDRPEDGCSLSEIERRAQRVAQRVEARIVQRSAERAAAELPRPVCCGQPMEVAARRERRQQGLCGDYPLKRTEYRCAHCGRRAVPADEFWGIGPGRQSPELSRVLAKAGAEIASFERASDLVGDVLGQAFDASTAARTSEAVGAVAGAEEQQAITNLPPSLLAGVPPAPVPGLPPLTLLLGIDATKANAEHEWRDAKVGVAAPLGPDDVTDPASGRRSLVLGPRVYCAAIENAEHFFARILALLVRAGWVLGQPLCLVLVGDGGPWIWDYVPRLRALGIEVKEILDIYHAREHLWAVAHAVFGQQSSRARFWGRCVSDRLAEEGGTAALSALQDLRPRGCKQREEVRKAIAYFAANSARTDYPRYAAQALPLGSGIVESACRLVSVLRVKQPGMRWSLAGVQSILALRALRLSAPHLWSAFWAGKPLLRRPPVATLHAS